MLDFDVGKLVVIGVVALIVIGPKDLPRVLRQVGQIVGKMRRMAGEFQTQFMDAMREADVENLKKEVEAVGDSAKFDVAFDPVKDVKDQLSSAVAGDVTPRADHDAEAAPPKTDALTGSLEIEEDTSVLGVEPSPARLDIEPPPPPPERLAVEIEAAREPEPVRLAESPEPRAPEPRAPEPHAAEPHAPDAHPVESPREKRA